MGKSKNKKHDNDNPYYEGYEDGYTQGLEHGYENGFNDKSVEEFDDGNGCEFCEDLEYGSYMYWYEDEQDAMIFNEIKIYYCPVCGASLNRTKMGANINDDDDD